MDRKPVKSVRSRAKKRLDPDIEALDPEDVDAFIDDLPTARLKQVLKWLVLRAIVQQPRSST